MLDTAVLELLASRICHDLISPVGAVHNGVEFLQEMGADAGDEAIELIAHSAQQASAKLQAFRMAYGAGGRDSNIKPEDVWKIFAALIETDGKITQDWDPHAPLGFDELPQGFCKLLMGVLMLAQESLPRGGSIAVQAGEEKNQTRITASGQGANLRAQVEDALALNVPVENLDPRLVHPYAQAILARHYNFNIQASEPATDTVSFLLGYT